MSVSSNPWMIRGEIKSWMTRVPHAFSAYDKWQAETCLGIARSRNQGDGVSYTLYVQDIRGDGASETDEARHRLGVERHWPFEYEYAEE
jgi:hypothetical protein